MAGNFWQSRQYKKWQLCKTEMLRARHSDLLSISEEEYRKITVFFSGIMQTLGEQLKKSLQRNGQGAFGQNCNGAVKLDEES